MVEMLIAHPEGMRIQHIASTIYNSNCDLFEQNSTGLYKRIHTSVKRYLWTQSRLRRSPFERCRWGTYKLRSGFVYQLELTFDDWEEEGLHLTAHPTQEPPPEKPVPFMLDLFAGHAF